MRLAHAGLELVSAAHQVEEQAVLEVPELLPIVTVIREGRADADREAILIGGQALGIELPEVAHRDGRAGRVAAQVHPASRALPLGADAIAGDDGVVVIEVLVEQPGRGRVALDEVISAEGAGGILSGCEQDAQR